MDNLREKALGLPALPGVYIMKDRQNRIIYVGKAGRLKNRVSSYFSGTHDAKTEKMTSRVADFDVIITASEFEALILENSLIKHHNPRYNIKLRDDKGYPFIRVDKEEEYPSFKIVSKPEKDSALYLGPYSGRSITREAIGAVCKALKLPTCGKDIKRMIGKERPCLNAHIGTCRAYCQDAELAGEHRESIDAAIDVFMGKTGELMDKLTLEMDQAAQDLMFEVAADKRDRLRAVQMLAQKQLVIAGGMADTDVIGFYRGLAKSCFAVLHYIEGKLISKDYELFDTPIEEDPEAISGIVRQYYELRGAYPKAIYLPVETSDSELLEKLFTSACGRRVYIDSPKRGDKAKLVDYANTNAREEAQRATSQEERTSKTLLWLQQAAGLDTSPERIEAYDVSNTGDSDIVAAMAVFVKGKALKKDFRRYKIKTVDKQDDYHSMVEVVSRRLARYISNDEKYSVLPDLMLIDGGATHASAIQSVLKEADVSVPVFGMVKDDKHKTRGLVSPDGEEIGIQGNPAVFTMIGMIQEQTHKYAVEYHRELRSKNTHKSKLDLIEGVGPKRRNALLGKFRSIKAVSAATVEELSTVVPKNTAEKIYQHFRQESGESATK